MKPLRIEPLGDRALLVVLGEHIDAELNRRVLACAEALRSARLAGVDDIVPAFASVCIHYDPSAWIGKNKDRPAQLNLLDRVDAILRKIDTAEPGNGDSLIEIPVCYADEFAPDLDLVATQANLSPEQVIARHTATEYRVAMLGFAPGFPYLLGLAAALHTPRRKQPRVRVPAGSVAIGGAQTGIYPRESPGGWQVIGRTPLVLFDASRPQPALLMPGRRVRFRAIDADEFSASKT